MITLLGEAALAMILVEAYNGVSNVVKASAKAWTEAVNEEFEKFCNTEEKDEFDF